MRYKKCIWNQVIMTNLREEALNYHSQGKPGKIGIQLTKPSNTARDLTLAYSPGVAEPVIEISKDPDNAYLYTNKSNTVGVISNGTAILGLGNLGALASKPVMEGKALLFKRFADIDATDILVDTTDPDEFINTVRLIAPTFGAINLEDIKAPECFEIEARLKEICPQPIFHDDQWGTAICVLAGLFNALELQGKTIQNSKIVCLGAGAAAIASMRLLKKAGANPNNLFVIDRKGVIHDEREFENKYKEEFAIKTSARTLDDVIDGADVFIGLSGPDLLSAKQLLKMAANPIIFACSNPNPEINVELAKRTRKDLIMATGRSDYPNQVNNTLVFPFLMRAALDVRASDISDQMMLATIEALRNLAKEPVPSEVLKAYNIEHLSFGKEYIIPKPTDPRLLHKLVPVIKQAAIESGVAGI